MPSNLFNFFFFFKFTHGEEGKLPYKNKKNSAEKIAYFCIKKKVSKMYHTGFLFRKLCARLLFVKERHGNTLTRYECSTI